MSHKIFISSDISVDERLVEIAEESPESVLLWPWLLTALDDWGRATADAKRLKYSVFPAIATVTPQIISAAIDLFARAELIELYEVCGKRYLAVPSDTWFKYQTHVRSEKRDSDKSRIPAPPSAQLRAVARDNAQLQTLVGNSQPSPSPSPSPSEENVPTERGASAPLAQDTLPVDKPATNGHKSSLPERRDSDTTDRAYWERILKEAPANQRTALLVRLAHEKIGADDTPGGSSYARLGKMAKDYHGAGLVATWILQAATEHIAGDPLDYLTVLAKKQTNRANQNGRTRAATSANREPVYATADQAAPKGWE